MADPNRGGIATTAKSWRRTIYLITDGMHAIDKGSIDSIQDRLKEDKISLRVIGVDFDDPSYGFQEEDKDSIKAENEQFWHEWLAKIPDAKIATAENALEQARLPTIQMQNSFPYKTMLTFGDPERAFNAETVLSIPVKMFKLTTRVLPMSRKQISKLAEEREAARRQREADQTAQSQFRSQDGRIIATPTPKLPRIDALDGGSINAYEVETRRIHFLSDHIREFGTDHADPLPEGAERDFDKAYKLGASVIPIISDLETQWQSKKGLEIINWVKAATFRRHFLLGEVWNVFADENDLSAQLRLSSLSKAMNRQDKLAIVRYVRQNNADPKIGVLYPVERTQGQTTAEYFHFAEVPFSDDLKRYTFPSLNRAITAYGKELNEHRTLPSERMLQAMEGLVDSMNLSRLYVDDDGHEQSWFSPENSFNPAIHRMKDAVAWRAMHPNSTYIPEPHWEIKKFLDWPEEIAKASAEHARECAKLFNVRYFPDNALARVNLKRQREAEQEIKNIRSRHELDLTEAGELDEEYAKRATPVVIEGERDQSVDEFTPLKRPPAVQVIGEESDTDDEEKILGSI